MKYGVYRLSAFGSFYDRLIKKFSNKKDAMKFLEKKKLKAQVYLAGKEKFTLRTLKNK